ncbi:hypothetical protein B0H67DRAFT_613465 [Lasiosphaeris hirsuta]|uniref:RRM domain-containing protein n=1 Tax=Lasiosphaeris hirsuta TaxID=260670 RepID=A0AA40DIL9_9PEZI|nr:hypothetical protein B0H67DRAFT_613465 [Lasiosphaeris hirsuta]
MVRELRERKAKVVAPIQVEKPAAKKAASQASPKTEKRKANEDASPIATKKQKAVKTPAVAAASKLKAVAVPVAAAPAPSKRKASAAAAAAKAAEVIKKDMEEEKTPKKSAAKAKMTKAPVKAKADKKKVAPVAEPEEEVSQKDEATAIATDAKEEKDEAAAEEEGVDDETQALVEQLDTENEDEEGDEDEAQISTYKKGQDVGKVPKAKKATRSSNGPSSGKPGVMYLGSVPHGFYEHEMREYFSQFGDITRLRVVRNKKTGASKHRAFLEFADAEVADIAARTMDNYLLFGHILKAKLVPEAQVHADLFKGSNRRFKAVPWNKMEGKHLEQPLAESAWQVKITKEEQRRATRAEKLKVIGYEFEAPALRLAEAKEQPVAAMKEVAVEVVEAPAAVVAEVEVEAKEVEVEVVEAEVKSISKTNKKVKKAPKARKAKA